MKNLRLLYPIFLFAVFIFLFFGVELPNPKGKNLTKQGLNTEKKEAPKARGISFKEPARRSPEVQIENTNLFLEKYKKDFNLQPYHEFRPTYFNTPEGSYVKYQVYQDGIWVWGMELLFKLDAEGEVIEKIVNYQPIEKLFFDTKDFGEIRDLMPSRYSINNAFEPSKIIFTETKDPTIAYVVRAFEKQKERSVQLIVRATDGLILKRIVNGRD